MAPSTTHDSLSYLAREEEEEEKEEEEGEGEGEGEEQDNKEEKQQTLILNGEENNRC